MHDKNRVEPDKCTGMEDIRIAIDELDHEVIAILGKRFEYVKAAASFKTSAASVKAPERFAAMLAQRRDWATAVGLSPNAIEKMYRDLVNHFINEEMSHWHSQSSEK